MVLKRKKIEKIGKDKKRTGLGTKGRSKRKADDSVCVLNDILVTEQVYCCDNECCCLL